MIPEGAIVSGFISKVINDLVDVSKDKIKKADRDRKTESQSFETRIYQVIIDALNEFTYDQYKTQNILYDAAENILNGLKKEEDNIVAVKSGLDSFNTNVNDTECERFMRVLCHEISKKINFDVYKEILLILLNQKDDCNYDELQQIRKKLDEVVLKLDNQITYNEKNIDIQDSKFQNNKKEDYLKIWNSRLFLHMDTDERPITLANAFIMPDYKVHQNFQEIDFSAGNTLDNLIEKFVNYRRTSTMLITGVPGMGKTTIVSWIAYKYKTQDNLIILRFRDWDFEELDSGLLKAICVTLKCKRKDLNKKILVLDGFDEIKSLDRRRDILNDFLNDIKDLEKSKIIITSRPNYITTDNFDNNIKILPFSTEKVGLFYNKITNIVLNEAKIDESNLDVMGIPVILYMAIMSNIDITEKTIIPELYNRIFAKRGGIFDRFSEYDNGSHILRNADNINKYLNFLQKIAFLMFKRDNLSLSKKKCEIPKLKFEGKDVSILEFPIKHFFESTSQNIEFIHKSIYEYFVSEYIFCSIREIIKEDTSKIEDLAGVMGRLFKCRKLPSEIMEFLEYKVRNSLNDKFDIVNDTFNLMLKDGMTYYSGECYRNIIDCELKVFANMLEIIHLWEKRFKFDKAGCNYLKINKRKGINLSNMDLIDLDLSDSYLVNADLSDTNLSKTTLRNANLERVKLDGVILKETDFRGSILIKVDFSNAILESIMLEDAKLYKTKFSANQIRYLTNDYDIQGDRVATTEYIKLMNILKDHHDVSNSQDKDIRKIRCQKEIDEIIDGDKYKDNVNSLMTEDMEDIEDIEDIEKLLKLFIQG